MQWYHRHEARKVIHRKPPQPESLALKIVFQYPKTCITIPLDQTRSQIPREDPYHEAVRNGRGPDRGSAKDRPGLKADFEYVAA
jgi:hypothetical protein